jgi:hypothetical protein
MLMKIIHPISELSVSLNDIDHEERFLKAFTHTDSIRSMIP